MQTSLVAYAPTIALLFFFMIFCGIAVWVARPGMKKKLQAHAHIPLEEDTNDR